MRLPDKTCIPLQRSCLRCPIAEPPFQDNRLSAKKIGSAPILSVFISSANLLPHCQ
jgi:hypothetical protein